MGRQTKSCPLKCSPIPPPLGNILWRDPDLGLGKRISLHSRSLYSACLCVLECSSGLSFLVCKRGCGLGCTVGRRGSALAQPCTWTGNGDHEGLGVLGDLRLKLCPLRGPAGRACRQPALPCTPLAPRKATPLGSAPCFQLAGAGMGELAWRPVPPTHPCQLGGPDGPARPSHLLPVTPLCVLVGAGTA